MKGLVFFYSFILPKIIRRMFYNRHPSVLYAILSYPDAVNCRWEHLYCPHQPAEQTQQERFLNHFQQLIMCNAFILEAFEPTNHVPLVKYLPVSQSRVLGLLVICTGSSDHATDPFDLRHPANSEQFMTTCLSYYHPFKFIFNIHPSAAVDFLFVYKGRVPPNGYMDGSAQINEKFGKGKSMNE